MFTAPPRFRAEPLSDYYVRLVDVIFAVTLSQSLVVYRKEIVAFSPWRLLLTLLVVYVTVALSWVGYHRSILKYPYNQSGWSKLRVSLDISILVVYAFLAFAASEPGKVILGLAAVFSLYAIDGCTRIAEWRDRKVSKPWLSFVFCLLLTSTWWLLHRGRISTVPALVAALVLVVAFREIRQWLGYPKLIIVGIDVDGVLGEQIPALLDRLRKEKNLGTGLTKSSITEWDFAFDGTDIAQEMENALLDPAFVLEMAPVNGASAALQKLYRDMHLVIATSRPLSTHNVTLQWLKKEFKFHEVVNTRNTGKAVLGLEVLVDDNIDNVRGFAQSGGTGILISQPWNQRAETDADLIPFFQQNRIVRCGDWTQVVSSLEAYRTTGKMASSVPRLVSNAAAGSQQGG